MASVTCQGLPHLNYTYQDGDAVKIGTMEIPVTSMPEFRSFFLLSFFKSGSVLVNNVVGDILKDRGIPTLDIPSHLFQLGIDIDSFLCDLDQAFPLKGYCFSGFRHVPRSFFGSNALDRARKVVVTRDPRDLLVSAYFSVKFSHQYPAMATAQFRHGGERSQRYAGRSIDDYCVAMACALNVELSYLQKILEEKDTLVLRYEDFIYDKMVIGRSIREWCGLDISDQRLAEIIKPHDILPECEQPYSHFRQGHPGDYLRKLQPATVAELNASLKTFMKTFGYSPLCPEQLKESQVECAARLDTIKKLDAERANLHAELDARLDMIEKHRAEQAKLHAELAARLDLIHELDAYVAILKRQLREHEKLASRFRLYPAAFVILFAAIMVLRNSVDAPPFNVLNTIIEACVLSAAMKWGGMTATITSLLFVISIDFFLVDPVLALGVNDWRALIELTFASALALGLGVAASRIFPSLLGYPSQA